MDTDDRGREGFGAGSETGFGGFFCRTALDGTLEGFGCGALDFALRTDDAIRRDSGSRGLSLGMRRPYKHDRWRRQVSEGALSFGRRFKQQYYRMN